MLAGATVLAPSAAYASGFMVRENSAESLATIFAGNASRADEPATVFNNPAGMSFLTGTQFQVGGTGVFPSIHFQGNSTIGSRSGPVVPADDSRNAGQFALAPHAYAVFDITPRVKAGIALTVPFGNTVDYSEAWSGRYVNVKTAALTADFNPNISFKVTDRFAIAAGVSLQYLKLDLSSKIPQFLIFGPGTPDGGYLLKIHDWDWGYNFGILAEPWDGTRLGLTYRSGVDHSSKGTLNFDPDTSPFLGLVNGPATADLSMPASVTGSITQQISPRFSVSSDVQYTMWNTFGLITVNSANPPFPFPEYYRDSWMISVGGVYKLNNQWTLRGGVGYDESPVVDAFRDTGVPDKDRYMVGIGFGYQFTPKAGVDVGYAHYFAAGHALMTESVNSIEPITQAVFLNGRYNNHLDYLSISFRIGL